MTLPDEGGSWVTEHLLPRVIDQELPMPYHSSLLPHHCRDHSFLEFKEKEPSGSPTSADIGTWKLTLTQVQGIGNGLWMLEATFYTSQSHS